MKTFENIFLIKCNHLYTYICVCIYIYKYIDIYTYICICTHVHISPLIYCYITSHYKDAKSWPIVIALELYINISYITPQVLLVSILKFWSTVSFRLKALQWLLLLYPFPFNRLPPNVYNYLTFGICFPMKIVLYMVAKFSGQPAVPISS